MSYRLERIVSQINRYGDPPTEWVDALEALVELNDDYQHGRSIDGHLDMLRSAVDAIATAMGPWNA